MAIIPEVSPVVKCACGCGAEFQSVYRRGRYTRYLTGHSLHWSGGAVASLDGEEWRPIPSVPRIQVSNMGRVRNHHGRILRATPVKGYRTIYIKTKSGVRHLAVHTAVLESFVGPRPKGCEARHLDDDRTNNRLDNLAWGSRTENIQDRRLNGIAKYGERHYNAKLTDLDIPVIRNRFASGETLDTIARSYPVGPSAIGKIVRRERWTNI